MNKDGVLEELCGYLGLKKDKKEILVELRSSSDH